MSLRLVNISFLVFAYSNFITYKFWRIYTKTHWNTSHKMVYVAPWKIVLIIIMLHVNWYMLMYPFPSIYFQIWNQTLTMYYRSSVMRVKCTSWERTYRKKLTWKKQKGTIRNEFNFNKIITYNIGRCYNFLFRNAHAYIRNILKW